MGSRSNLSKEVHQAVRKFKRASGIEKVFIFGSQVTNKEDEHSDVDLILVDPRFKGKKVFKRSIGLRKYWPSDMPVDFLCYTPEEYERLKNKPTIVAQAEREGVRIKL